jgi:hypothetical protein
VRTVWASTLRYDKSIRYGSFTRRVWG